MKEIEEGVVSRRDRGDNVDGIIRWEESRQRRGRNMCVAWGLGWSRRNPFPAVEKSQRFWLAIFLAFPLEGEKYISGSFGSRRCNDLCWLTVAHSDYRVVKQD